MPISRPGIVGLMVGYMVLSRFKGSPNSEQMSWKFCISVEQFSEFDFEKNYKML